MPTPTHEVFAARISTAIQVQLLKISEKDEVEDNDGSPSDFAKDIEAGASSTIELERGPDPASYRHPPPLSDSRYV